MSQNKIMEKNDLEKQSLMYKNAGALSSTGAGLPPLVLPPLVLPDLGSPICSFSGNTDSPLPPPPSFISNADDNSGLSNTRPGALIPSDTGKEDTQETKEEMFPSPCDYGEPMRPQHLVLDFTPIEGVDDNAYTTKKVQDFWKFIRSVPGLDNLQASPEDWDEMENGEDISLEESEDDGSEKLGTVHDSKSAIPWMTRDPHMMCTAFAARQKGRYCEQGGGDYFALKTNKITKKSSLKPGTSQSSHITKQHAEGLGSPRSSQASESLVDVHMLCKQLDEWDHLHPSTLEPPATPPRRGYNNVELQRKT